MIEKQNEEEQLERENARVEMEEAEMAPPRTPEEMLVDEPVFTRQVQ